MKTKDIRAKVDVADLLPIGMTIVVLAIGLAIGLQILGETKADMTSDSYEANATQEGIEALAKFPTKLGLIVTVIVAAVVIGILMRYMFFQR